MGVSREDVPIIAKATRRNGLAVSLTKGRRTVAIRERRDVLRLVRYLRVHDPYRTSNKLTLVSIAPNRVMAIISGTSAQIVAMRPFAGLEGVALRLRLLQVSIPVGNILTRSRVGHRPTIYVVAARRSNVPFTRECCHAVRCAVKYERRVAKGSKVHTASPRCVFAAFKAFLPQRAKRQVTHGLRFARVLFFIELVIFLCFLSSYIGNAGRIVEGTKVTTADAGVGGDL